MSNQEAWHRYFMTMAYLVATKSKDPRTKVGAIIVGSGREIRSTGYNGLPRGMHDSEERYQKPLKLKLINHAEENAILHCSKIGISMEGCILYIPWIPCSLCAKSIIQVGIKEVVYHEEWKGNHNRDTIWAESIELTKEMFAETNIKLTKFSGKLVKPVGYYQGQEVDLF